MIYLELSGFLSHFISTLINLIFLFLSLISFNKKMYFFHHYILIKYTILMRKGQVLSNYSNAKNKRCFLN